MKASATVVPSLTALFSRYCEQTQRGTFIFLVFQNILHRHSTR